jgi:recombination protein RecT
MKRVFMTAVRKTRELLACTRDSLFNALSEAASDGLMPDGREGAMVVRHVDGKKVAKWQPMAEGIRKKARNSGDVATWEVSVVYEKDDFDFAKGDNPFISHKPHKGADHGPWIAVYSIVTLKDGSKLRDVMWKEEVLAIRDKYSDGWKAFKAGKIKTTPWKEAEEEMARKTIVHRHRKEVPASIELHEMLFRDMESDRRTDEDAPMIESRPEPKKLNGNGKRDPMDEFAGTESSEERRPLNRIEPGEVEDAEVVGETVDPETGEITEDSEAASAADAYQAGRAAFEAGKPIWPIPDEWRKTDAMGNAYCAGFNDAHDEAK